MPPVRLLLSLASLLSILVHSLVASDYQAELQEIDRALAKTDSAARGLTIETLHHLHGRYRRASLTGDTNDLHAIASEIEAAMPSQLAAPPSPNTSPPFNELLAIQLKVYLKLHRLPEAKAILESRPLSDSLSLRAELALQQDNLFAAGQLIEKASRAKKSWDNLARLAHYHALMGRHKKADGLYSQAQDLLTVKEMRYFAWLELQRGHLDFTTGRFEEAGTHYLAADAAYSGYWLIQEAIAIYGKILPESARPENSFALGMLYKKAGQKNLSNEHLDHAHQAFLDSAVRGESHYLHNLVEYYIETQNGGPLALKWAKADFALRPNAQTRHELAWVYFLNGQPEEAQPLIELTFQSKLQDAHLIQHASRIYAALGMKDEAATLTHLELGNLRTSSFCL